MNREGYVRINVDGTKCRAHRLAYLYMTGEWPPKLMDHINRVKSDNRWANLRPVTEKLNFYNTSDYRNNKSGAKGVSWYKNCNKWVAKIGKNYRQRFTRFEDAVKARKTWEAEFMKGNYTLHRESNHVPLSVVDVTGPIATVESSPAACPV